MLAWKHLRPPGGACASLHSGLLFLVGLEQMDLRHVEQNLFIGTDRKQVLTALQVQVGSRSSPPVSSGAHCCPEDVCPVHNDTPHQVKSSQEVRGVTGLDLLLGLQGQRLGLDQQRPQQVPAAPRGDQDT